MKAIFKDLKIGDKVKITDSIIVTAKNRLNNEKQIEIFGKDLLEKSYNNLLGTFTILGFENLNGAISVKIDQKSLNKDFSFYPHNCLVKVEF